MLNKFGILSIYALITISMIFIFFGISSFDITLIIISFALFACAFLIAAEFKISIFGWLRKVKYE